MKLTTAVLPVVSLFPRCISVLAPLATLGLVKCNSSMIAATVVFVPSSGGAAVVLTAANVSTVTLDVLVTGNNGDQVKPSLTSRAPEL